MLIECGGVIRRRTWSLGWWGLAVEIVGGIGVLAVEYGWYNVLLNDYEQTVN